MGTRDELIAEMVKAGVPEDRAAEFAGTGLSIEDVAQYVSSGLGLGDIHDVRETGLPITEYGQWVRLLHQARFVRQAVEVGLTLSTAEILMKDQQVPTVDGILRLLGSGLTPDDVMVLLENNVYLGRYSPEPGFNIADVLMKEVFGSTHRWHAWKCLGLSLREALALERNWRTPLEEVVGGSTNMPTPRADYITELKTFRFTGGEPPSQFESMKNRKWTEALLRGIGYRVVRTSLSTEFLEDQKFDVSVRIREARSIALTAALAEDENGWTFNSIHGDGAQGPQSRANSLSDALMTLAAEVPGERVSEWSFGHGIHASKITEELLLSLGELMGKVIVSPKVFVRSEQVTVHTALDGRRVAIPEHEVERPLPGRDEIVRVGPVALRYFGLEDKPAVVIGALSDDQIREATSTWLQSLSALSKASVAVVRHHLEEIDVEDETDVVAVETTTPLSISSIADLESCRELFLVRENEVLEVVFDTSIVSAEDIGALLQLAPEGEWNNEESFLDLLNEIDNDTLYEVHTVPEEFATRLAVLNGQPWMAMFADNPVFTPVEDEGYLTPILSAVYGEFSFIELESRTSGTSVDLLGALAGSCLIRVTKDDDYPPDFFRIKSDAHGVSADVLVDWLLDENFWTNTKSLMFIEQEIGFLKGRGMTTHACINEGESSTLEMYLALEIPDSITAQEIIAKLVAQNSSCAEAVRAIEDPESELGRARLRRLEEFDISSTDADADE